MKRCKCGEILEAPLAYGTYRDRLSECLNCEMYWDGKQWLTSDEVTIMENKLEGKNKTGGSA